MKIIAFYLPQYHETKENNEWWGKGYTEWTNIQSAKPIFSGHYQPRIPLENNYYNLLNNDVFKWQINLAKQYGVYGFCFYHYWFDGKLLLNKPLENFLADKSLNIHFCMCWANENWVKRTPKGDIPLIQQHYGDKKEWKDHFLYLLPYFKDNRYIKENNKPLLVIYRPDVIPKLNEMLDYWNELAKDAGFSGICYAYQHISFDLLKNKDDSKFDYNIEYQPTYVFHELLNQNFTLLKKWRRSVLSLLEKKFALDLRSKLKPQKLIKTDYDTVWTRIINKTPNSEKNVPGAFVDWDNTPRYGKRGSVCVGANPDKFYKYMRIQIKNAKEKYHKNMIFLFAWNEWGESGYLEPDEKYKFGYLDSLKRALIDNNEFPAEEK